MELVWEEQMCLAQRCVQRSLPLLSENGWIESLKPSLESREGVCLLNLIIGSWFHRRTPIVLSNLEELEVSLHPYSKVLFCDNVMLQDVMGLMIQYLRRRISNSILGLTRSQ